MTYLSIIEKLSILFNTMMDFYFILVFCVLIMIFTFLYIVKKITIKKYSLLMLLSFIIVFGISIISNYDVLSNTFDNFTTIFFGNIYFPSIYVYIAVLVISLIAFMVSVFNVMLGKVYKIINSIMFVVNNMLFVVILNIIAKNKIDIFSIQSLYSNTSLVAILELSMGLFILWIFSLFVVYITNTICINFASRKNSTKNVKEEVFSPIIEVSNEVTLDVNSLSDEVAADVSVEAITNTEIEETSYMVEGVFQDNVVVENSIHESNSDLAFNDILNSTIPVTYYENEYVNNEYELVDPQNVYEDNYNKVKMETTFNDVVIQDNEIDKSILSLEEITDLEKKKVSEERLINNTISLNDLIVEENSVNIIEVDNSNIEYNNDYTMNDYKKVIEMLTKIKSYANGTNINIDDAVAIGLINNYSIDDCMKFKSILENNLN